MSKDIFDRPGNPELTAQITANPDVATCFNKACRVVQRIKFPGYNLNVHRNIDSVYVYVTYTEPDVFSGVSELQQGRKWIIENDWSEGQIVQTFFKAILTSLEHRAREHFTVDDYAVMNPHFSLGKLLKLTAESAKETHRNNEITFAEMNP